MSLSVRIEVIPHAGQRYNTVGDWYYRNPFALQVRISSLGNEDYEFLIAVHEFIEAYLCRARTISTRDVDVFDKMWQGPMEPGDSPEAPYHKEHRFATVVERMLAAELGIDWEKYEFVLGEVTEARV